MTRNFHLSDILSITTGRLVSTRHMEGVYEILNWMTQDDLFTHQLGRASEECAPILCTLYPELSETALAGSGDVRGQGLEADLPSALD